MYHTAHQTINFNYLQHHTLFYKFGEGNSVANTTNIIHFMTLSFVSNILNRPQMKMKIMDYIAMVY